MKKPLIQFLSETSGSCCIWAFLMQFKGLTNQAAADKIGVSLRTLVEERSALNNGAYRCRKNSGCKNGECGNNCHTPH